MRGGFIKLHRKILEWEWYTEPHMLRLFVHLIFSANYEDKSWRGIEVKRGSFITSWQGLSESLNLSVQTVRTCIKRLESTGEISRKSTNKFTIITICKYDSYQDFNPISNNQVTNEQQTTNKQLTTTKEYKEYKEVKNKEKVYKKKFIPPSIDDVKQYFQEKGYREDVAVKAFEYYELGNWKDSRGNPVKNWKQKMFTNWMKPEYKIQQKQERYLEL